MLWSSQGLARGRTAVCRGAHIHNYETVTRKIGQRPWDQQSLVCSYSWHVMIVKRLKRPKRPKRPCGLLPPYITPSSPGIGLNEET